MKIDFLGRASTLIGAVVLALTIGVMLNRPVKAPQLAPEEMRDAFAAPISPAVLGGARVVQPNLGYFASPAGRRAEAERAMMSSRGVKVSKATRVRASKRLEARRRVLVVQ